MYIQYECSVLMSTYWLLIIQKRKKCKPLHQPTFSALHLINDPQSFVEKLFNKLEHSKEKFEVRLMLMSLISRLIGLHQVSYRTLYIHIWCSFIFPFWSGTCMYNVHVFIQLFLFNFYPFLQRYLQPHQHEVTKLLTFLAQASHELVPAEVWVLLSDTCTSLIY